MSRVNLEQGDCLTNGNVLPSRVRGGEQITGSRIESVRARIPASGGQWYRPAYQRSSVRSLITSEMERLIARCFGDSGPAVGITCSRDRAPKGNVTLSRATFGRARRR